MNTKYKFRDHDQLYFVTFSLVNWIDLFIRNEYKDIMIDSWKHCQQNKGFEIYGWCIMTSHLHMIIGARVRHAFGLCTAYSRQVGGDLLGATGFFKIINESDFVRIRDFLVSQQKFYTNDSKKNHGDYDDYAIDINVDNSILARVCSVDLCGGVLVPRRQVARCINFALWI